MKKIVFCLLMLIAVFSVDGQVYFGAKFEPKEGIYSGAGQSDLFTKSKDYFYSYNNFANAVGVKPAITMDYLPLGISVGMIQSRFEKIKKNLPPGVKLQIGIGFTGASIFAPKKDLCKDIIAGDYDRKFEEIGKQLSDLNTDCFVRLGLEFDLKMYGYIGSDYKLAYVHAANILREKCSRMALVWCSAGGSGKRWNDTTQMSKSYPGDEYVDWFGVDVFDAYEWPSKPMATFLEYAGVHQKPVMIGETTPRGVGVTLGKLSWEKWFVPMLETLNGNPIIKAVCYVNWDWKAENSARFNPGWGNWGDCRVEESPFIKDALAKELAGERWVHAE